MMIFNIRQSSNYCRMYCFPANPDWLLEFPVMGDSKHKKGRVDRTDVAALEADVAYFGARLSLAANQQDTSYQKAQKKAYETLGEVMSGTLDKLRKKPGA